MVIHGIGLDEISPLGPCKIFELKKTGVDSNGKNIYERKDYEFDPLSVGIPRCELEDLKGGTPEVNRQEFLKVLEGGKVSNVSVSLRVYSMSEIETLLLKSCMQLPPH